MIKKSVSVFLKAISEFKKCDLGEDITVFVVVFIVLLKSTLLCSVVV